MVNRIALAGSLIALALLAGCGGSGLASTPEATAQAATQTLGLLPSNPRYFSAPDGKPLLLVGDYCDSAFLDRKSEYDFRGFFDTLHASGLNFARLWVWTGCEYFPPEFEGRNYIPCLRTGPGLARDGLPKWDLSRFDRAFFQRLQQVCAEARKRGLYLQLTLFDAWNIKHAQLWELHAFHRDNNVNGVDGDPRQTGTGTDGEQGFCSLGNPGVLTYQQQFVLRVIHAVNGFDNILFEIANENYYSADWELELCRYLHQIETRLPRRHLVMPLDLPNHDYGGIKTWTLRDLHANLLQARQLGQPEIFDTDGIGNPSVEGVRRGFWTVFVSGGHVSYMDGSFQTSSEWGNDPRTGETRQVPDVTGGAVTRLTAPDNNDWALWLRSAMSGE